MKKAVIPVLFMLIASVTWAQTISETIFTASLNCYGDNNGWAKLEPGYSNYTYRWNNGDSGYSVTGLSAGIYAVTVTSPLPPDTAVYYVTITQPGQLQFQSIYTTPAGCRASGSLTANVTGGQRPYTYAWSDGSISADSVLANKPTGTYAITVADANQCSTTDIANIGQLPSTLGITTIDSMPSGCKASGSLAVTVTGGQRPYTYSWNGSSSPDSVLANIDSGTYTVTVTDANTCSATAIASIGRLPDPLSITSIDSTASGCKASGSLAITATGGQRPYNYAFSWNGSSSTDSVLADIPGGTYAITVTDANTCSATAMAYIGQLSAPLIITSIDSMSSGCKYSGSLAVTVTGGQRPYNYAWSNPYMWNGGGPSSPDSVIVNVDSGTYTITVTDANTCSVTAMAYIGRLRDSLAASIITQGITCYGDTDGKAYVQVTSSNPPPYNFLWSNGATTDTAKNLPADTFTVTVTDVLGCTAADTIILSSPLKLQDSAFINPICSYTDMASVFIITSGGTAPYTYLWSNSQTTDSITVSLSPLPIALNVTVTDANHCKDSIVSGINFRSAIDSLKVTASTGLGGGLYNMQVIAGVSGGKYPYIYEFDFPYEDATDTTNQITHNEVGPGPCLITVIDANGCEASDSVYFNNFPAGINPVTGQANLQLYPNPANEQLNINIVPATGDLRIFDVQGKIVYQQNVTGLTGPLNINTASWSTGTYVIELTQNEVLLGTFKLSVMH